MVPKLSVLIVDRSDESRDVLRTALERRGLEVYEASRTGDGLALACECRPDMIVLDIDDASANTDTVGDELTRASTKGQIPVLFLGTVGRKSLSPSHVAIDSATGQRQFVAKPYHYRSLILKIEQMLRQCRRAG